MYGARASTGNPPREPGAPLRKSRKNSKKNAAADYFIGRR